MARERNPVLKGLLRIRRYNHQETPYTPKSELLSWLHFGEAYSLCGGWLPISGRSSVPFRLTFSGTEDLPFTHDSEPAGAAPQGKSTPDKHRSIGRKRVPFSNLSLQAQWKPLAILCLGLPPYQTTHLPSLSYPAAYHTIPLTRHRESRHCFEK